MSSPESERDSSDSEDYDLRVVEAIRENQNTIHVAASFLSWYYASYIDKKERKTPTYSGLAWVMDALNDPEECYDIFRMMPRLFYKLHDELVSDSYVIYRISWLVPCDLCSWLVQHWCQERFQTFS
jgi:hypothetical protein